MECKPRFVLPYLQKNVESAKVLINLYCFSFSYNNTLRQILEEDKMRKFIILSLLFISYQSHANEIESLFGEWRGAGDQDNGSHWTIRIHAQADFVVIDYPSLVCGGLLKPIRTLNNNWLFKEQLGYGKTRCLDQGDLILDKISNDELRYYWFGTNGLLQARGTLTRELNH